MDKHIEQMYKGIRSADVRMFDEVEEAIKRGEIELNLDSIVPLCKLSIIDSEYIEYSQVIEIVRIVFLIMGDNGTKEGLGELVKGLEMIYAEEKRNPWIYRSGESYKDVVERYISTFIMCYKEKDMILLGDIMSENMSIECKKEIIKVVRESIDYNDEKKGYKTKGELLIENIKCGYASSIHRVSIGLRK